MIQFLNSAGMNLLQNVYSLMADAAAINSDKKSEVNKRQEEFFIQDMGREFHVLECVFHVNKI